MGSVGSEGDGGGWDHVVRGNSPGRESAGSEILALVPDMAELFLGDDL
jgi:hypothetical protein